MSKSIDEFKEFLEIKDRYNDEIIQEVKSLIANEVKQAEKEARIDELEKLLGGYVWQVEIKKIMDFPTNQRVVLEVTLKERLNQLREEQDNTLEADQK